MLDVKSEEKAEYLVEYIVQQLYKYFAIIILVAYSMLARHVGVRDCWTQHTYGTILFPEYKVIAAEGQTGCVQQKLQV